MATIAPPPSSSQVGGSPFSPDILSTGKVLRADESIYSQDGRYNLTLQRDGQLALYDNSVEGGKKLWGATLKDGKNAVSLVMQEDANLVAYAKGGDPIWASDTWNKGSGSHLKMQNDGNLVVYNGSGTATWASDTYQV